MGSKVYKPPFSQHFQNVTKCSQKPQKLPISPQKHKITIIPTVH